MSLRRGTAGGGPEDKGQQCRTSCGLEHPGLGALSHRADQEAGPGGAGQGDVTGGKQSEQKHGDHRAAGRSGYQETQADKRSVARGAGTRTMTVQSSTRLTTAFSLGNEVCFDPIVVVQAIKLSKLQIITRSPDV